MFMDKATRQSTILKLIENNEIGTQQELLAMLIENGFSVKQATVSRDIRELNLVKALGEGKGYKYVAAGKNDTNNLLLILSKSLTTADCTGNFVVVKTLPGMAQAAGAAVDAMKNPDIMGCIAGDDTILVITRNHNSAKKLTGDLCLKI